MYVGGSAERKIGFACRILFTADSPADVFIGENGLLYCMYEFKEEIDVFRTPAEILELYLRNDVPIGVDRKPVKRSYKD